MWLRPTYISTFILSFTDDIWAVLGPDLSTAFRSHFGSWFSFCLGHIASNFSHLSPSMLCLWPTCLKMFLFPTTIHNQIVRFFLNCCLFACLFCQFPSTHQTQSFDFQFTLSLLGQEWRGRQETSCFESPTQFQSGGEWSWNRSLRVGQF